MKIRVLIQARMSSSRLPGKSLLPIGGIPLAILCSLRALNEQWEVVLITSLENSDDALEDEAINYQIRVHRGSLSNVLSRYVGASKDLQDNDIVVRLTADNPIVNSDFIANIVNSFSKSNCDYLGSSSPKSKLPYGLCAEVMYVGSLRKANRNANNSYEREHVTPWIIKNLRSRFINANELIGDNDFSNLRCTVDTPDDYANVVEVFKDIEENPIDISWKVLIKKLCKISVSPDFRIPTRGRNESVLTIGTAQFGLNYGVVNHVGMPCVEDAINLLHLAISHGVNWIDTARLYGAAEDRVGQALSEDLVSRVRINTKLDSLDDLSDTDSVARVEEVVQQSLLLSQNTLCRRDLDVVLLHRWGHRYSHKEAIWKFLLGRKHQGLIKELGVSLYNPEEAIEALADNNITHIQIPFNLLDHRWLSSEVQKAFSARPDVRVHARSVFLQGLLLNNARLWPDWVEEPSFYIDRIDELVMSFGRKNRTDLCLAYVLSHKWINSIVIGVETEHQLMSNLKLACELPLSDAQCKILSERFKSTPERLLNPSLW